MLRCNINFNSFVFLKIVWCEETHTGYTCGFSPMCVKLWHCVHYWVFCPLWIIICHISSLTAWLFTLCTFVQFFRCEKACEYLEFQLFWMICCIVHICHLSNISLPWMLRWVFRESSRPIDLSHFCIWISGKQKISQRETQFCVE